MLVTHTETFGKASLLGIGLPSNSPSARSTKLSRYFREAFDGLLSGVNTSMPAHVISFDAATQLAEIQVSIMLRTADGDIERPPIVMVPVSFAGGNAFVIEHQIDPGDEGVAIFSQRSIDVWLDQGGPAAQGIARKFDMTDAMFLPGLRSQKNKVSGFNNDGIMLRNKSGDQHFWIKSDGSMEISASTITINGDIISNGAINNNGNIVTSGTLDANTVNASTTLTAAGKNIGVHAHPAGNPPGNTGPNI